MASNHHNDEIFVTKRKPKGEIKFNISLNEEQKEAKQLILSKPVTFLDGKAGSGKTSLAVQIALDLLFKKEITQIIVARPFVTAGEDLGYLPGGVDQKLEYLIYPIHNLMKVNYSDGEKIDKLIKDEIIKIFPVGFLRGNTFDNSVIIIDEAQNCTKLQTELILGRLGETSKLIFCGDKTQCDLPKKLDSGIGLLSELSKNLPDFGYFKLNKNHRHPLVEDILNYIKENNL
jgi:phosphate starvation-inducible PhoH-like protein